MGGLLFVTSNVSRVPLAALVRELKPFLLAHGAVLMLLWRANGHGEFFRRRPGVFGGAE